MVYSRLSTFLFLLIFISVSFGQNVFDAKKTCGKITLDGVLNDQEWSCSDTASNFVIAYPNFGVASKFQSFVHILYDDEAIYIGAKLIDPAPDSVNFSLSQRDDFGNADWFGIRLDPYATNQTSFLFAVTAAGVEIDAIEYIDDSDYSWNAVWRSAVRKTDFGYAVEMKIPLSAIRFPEKEIQEWNINLGRSIRRNREASYWNPIDPNVYGEITQSGKLLNIENLKPPLRLSLSPYLTGYVENSYNSVLQKQVWSQRLAGGMDLKYGVNDAFTIDATLIPDFGQTLSDQQVLNLSPFEIQYNENRPFFLEGMDLFRIAGLFYTRRVGGVPHNLNVDLAEGDKVKALPLTSPIINASKFSGRTKSGLGIGVFNAIEGQAFARVEDSLGIEREVNINPLTNYNVFVLSQNLKNNGVLSFVNTNVLRSGSARDANVAAVSSTLFSSDRAYKVDATIKNSSLFTGGETVNGHSFFTAFSKVAGTWRYAFSYNEDSDTYNPNDLGYLAVNNKRNYYGMLRWNDFTPGKTFLRKWFTTNVYYNELYKPQLFSSLNIDWSYRATTKKFLTAGIDGGFSPLGYVDHFESREFGKEVKFGPSVRLGGFYSSDYSKPFALDVFASATKYTENRQYYYSLEVSPRVRFNDRLFIVWSSSYNHYDYDLGFVYQHSSDYESDRIILGRRDRNIIINSLSGELIFTNRMGLDLQFRHYWQQVDYSNFVELERNSQFLETSYDPKQANGQSVHNTSYDAFTVDINYLWVFYPGCQLRIVYKNNIFKNSNELLPDYFSTFDSLFDQPQINSISMKLLVFVDVLYFKNKKSRM